MARAQVKPEEANRESARVEFKEQLDPADGGEWCEVIKDIVAMANSGGGSIVLGVKNDGTLSGWNPFQLLSFDPAKIVDKIARYTGQQFSEFTIQESQRAGKRVAVIEVQAVAVPMVFVRPGTYDIGSGKQKTAFGAGALYFRHGSKSEPAAPEDLKACVQREVDRARRELLGNIRKLAYLPVGYQLRALPAKLANSSDPSAMGMGLVDDPTAPVVRGLDPNKTHPYRLKEALAKVNQKLKGKKTINSYDIQCIRKVYRVDEKRPSFFYKPMFGAAQYSDKFVEWIVNEHQKDPRVFDRARGAIRRGMPIPK